MKTWNWISGFLLLAGASVWGIWVWQQPINQPGQPFQWTYGPARADYTLTLYSDLECPYCKAFQPIAKHWIDNTEGVNTALASSPPGWAWVRCRTGGAAGRMQRSGERE